MDNFIVVSDVYPTLSCKVADLILPSAMIFEKWGAYGNSERRTQVWRAEIHSGDGKLVATGTVRLLCLDSGTEQTIGTTGK